MPLQSGGSKKIISSNIGEFHHGATYEHTKEKFGKERANKQAVAVAYAMSRKSKKK